ncbi:uncharacterized protein LOC123880088 [Maniola jurtina]|uniref:uncharacterized protein LOC123880088 n=1 Tax=Maniola jurtina TaxID=191418 RepID=UPI001E68F8B0|nr:uncharacterized protein LOC123880088 [Maniola jurtina]
MDSEINENSNNICHEINYFKNHATELFHCLINREKKPGLSYLTIETRSNMMDLFVRGEGPRGNAIIVQTAAWYFDTVAASATIESDDVKVVAGACYLMATKLHGSSKRATDLVSSPEKVLRLETAERSIMKLLNFPWQPVVAQYFITYWSVVVCDPSNCKEFEAAATFIHTAALVKSKVLSLNYPSVLAAAAMCTALNMLDEFEFLKRLGKNTIYQDVVRDKIQHLTLCTEHRDVLLAITQSGKYRGLNENMEGHPLIKKMLISLQNKRYGFYLP